MKVKCISDKRDYLLSILERELGENRVYHPLPYFSYSVGEYMVDRSGYIIADDDKSDLFPLLASLGFCEGNFREESSDEKSIFYCYDSSRVQTLINLFCIFSARAQLINKSLMARGAFTVSRPLMQSILNHPPLSTFEFFQMIYGRENDYRGIKVCHSYVSFPGFLKAPPEESNIHHQLADCIMNVALTKSWIKPFIKRPQNQKYVMKTWLNAIGMTGSEHEYARRIMLSRLNNCKKKEDGNA